MNTSFILAEYRLDNWRGGYEKGKVYPLLVTRYSFLYRLLSGKRLEISRLDGKGCFGYLNEWDFIQDWIIIPEGKYAVSIKKLRGGGKNEKK